ncbi:hypothetical protein GH714_039656 [Hevea brasiliensis]|uniref:Protein kinase domain-containing protein n=1 Tax=Hevea brasiliensis TaxID=3981 RepID=A0A6A6KM16_HEVBR|nr:hypothetical protein GH714_039656 [Hevea brasiliensis]
MKPKRPYYSAASSPDRNFGGDRLKHSTPVSIPEESVLPTHEPEKYDQGTRAGVVGLSQSHQKEYTATSSIRSAVSLGRTFSVPSPFCLLCQHKVPVFGKPPRQFSYEELEEATEGFSDMNFLAEGGFGNVYRGILRDGQVADFGLARWHSEWSINAEERVVGTPGYLAPEYIDGGKITHKVYV